ncbi:MAG: class I SAM-dependent methyltransferase, partial [Alphaproteobacteria bacterium]
MSGIEGGIEDSGAMDDLGAMDDWGASEDLAVVTRLVPPAGRAFADVGCGKGTLARALARLGATVLAIEPEPGQAADNAAAPEPGVRFLAGVAQALPAEDRSLDAVVFGSSLHHVPPEAMDRALAEARRVLGRPRGTLVVLEPEIACGYAWVTQPFHDETVVRRAAQAALSRAAKPWFGRRRTIAYTETYRYPDFEAFVAEIVTARYNAVPRARVATAEVEARFNETRVAAGFALEHRMRADVFD